MDILFSLLLYPFGIYVGLLSSYVLVVTLMSWFRRDMTFSHNAECADTPSVAVLIPAHNEEKQINAVLASLSLSNYPGPFKAFVIADNCQDATADLAGEAGARVFERTDPDNPGKGQAINWALTEHGAVLRDFDYIAFVDADTEVDPLFLSCVCAALAPEDVDAMQGFHSVLNAEDNWRTSFTYLGFAGINHVRPAGQFRLGANAGIKGNGMAFKTQVLMEMGWPAHSIVEDLEISLMLLMTGKRVAYNGAAIVRSEMPLAAEQADTQRERWEGGRYQIIREYLPTLFLSFFKTGRWKYLDALLDLALPPFTLMLLMVLAALFGGWLFGLRFLVEMGWLGMLSIAFYCFSALVQTRASKRVWRNLAAAPLFLMWKIPLSLKLLGNKQKDWNRTVRKDELK